MKKANFALGASAVALAAALSAVPFSVALAPCEPDDPDLLAYWKLDEGTGSLTLDFTDNNFDGTLVNGASFSGSTAPTAFDNPYSLELDGVNDYVSVPSGATLNPTTAMTISVWVRPDGGTDNVVVSRMNSTSPASKNLFYLGEVGGTWYFWISEDGSLANRAYVTMTTAPTDGVWSHVAGRYDAGSNLMRVYLNGSSVTGPRVGTLPTGVGTDPTVPLHIGRRQYNGTPIYYDGLIDDLRIYDRAISTDELDDLADGECFTAYCQGRAVTILGTSGNDTLDGTSGTDVISGLAGDDTINGLGGNDYLCGGSGVDTISGGDGRDRIEGGDGNDSLTGGDDRDYIYGNDDDDYIHGNAGDDRLYGNNGNDTILGGKDRDRIYGGFGNDYLEGNKGRDTLSGGFGVDTLYGGDDRDTLDGGFGDDTIFGGEGDDRLDGGLDDDELHGGDGRDRLRGSIGDDTLFGDGGDDRLYGSIGDDWLDGGADDDRMDGSNGEDIMSGRTGDDRMDGGIGDDRVCGNEGDDRIKGGIGEDLLDGGADTDRLDGGLNDDDCFNGENNRRCETESTGPSLCDL